VEKKKKISHTLTNPLHLFSSTKFPRSCQYEERYVLEAVGGGGVYLSCVAATPAPHTKEVRGQDPAVDPAHVSHES